MNGRVLGALAALSLGSVCAATLVYAQTAQPPETTVPTKGPVSKRVRRAGTSKAPPATRWDRSRPGAAAAAVVAAAPPHRRFHGRQYRQRARWRQRHRHRWHAAALRCTRWSARISTAPALGGVTDGVARVAWKPNTKWTYSYPFALPAGGGDVTGVGIDGQDNAWIWQRNQPGKPALFKFDPESQAAVRGRSGAHRPDHAVPRPWHVRQHRWQGHGPQ